MTKLLISFIVVVLIFSCPAYAADGATLIFRSGQVVRINDGFKDVIVAMKDLNSRSQDHHIVQLDIGGGTFLLNVAEVVIACRDDCKGLEVIDRRDPARSQVGGGR